ncbi:LAMI_0H00848g1_1 [Lachancea mirantina]|uniref:LAMI_0H00848g1_1 n=1 Tax=Lachancea mirantina TaxID=1230905 RepID=A0A1G4KDJ2_9SACH|nr:LAMI_0H00848g1_1 [Lachancea mirantina]
MSKNDPRDTVEQDPYNVLTSDEDENIKIQAEIDELERRAKDLKTRLQPRDRIRSNSINKEVKAVENTPREKSHNFRNNINATKGRDENGTTLKSCEGHSTPYFTEKFAQIKKREDYEIRRAEEFLRRRTHTFDSSRFTNDREPQVVNEKEKFSGKWISRRFITHGELSELLDDKKVLRLPKLFSKVRPPKFTEPEYPNWVVFGVLTNKSDIKMTSSKKPSKFFKLTLSDFKYTIDVFVFNKANVEKYFNLKVGDIIGILNPDILPWRPSRIENDESSGYTVKSFNLSIRHESDCIIEIGTSRDFALCPVTDSSTGKCCGTAIDRSTEDRCQYHQETRFRKVNAQRLELNGNKSLRAPTQNGLTQTLYQKSSKNRKNYELFTEKTGQGLQDGSRQNKLYFSNPNYAKAFFDQTYQNPDILANLESKRRKIKNDSKETLLQRQLASAIKKSSSTTTDNLDQQTRDKMRSTTERALQNGLMNKIGFDPTNGQMTSLLRATRGKGWARTSSNDVKDVMYSKKTNIVLAPSKKELKKRIQRREEVWKEHFERREEQIDSGRVAVHENAEDEKSNESSNESELDII